MNVYACTPIPARRVSKNGKVELRVTTEAASFVRISVDYQDGTILPLGVFPLAKDTVCQKIYPDLQGVLGRFLFVVEFLSETEEVLYTWRQAYEIIDSPVHSTRTMDGCFVTLYHWSELEGAYYNEGLAKLTDEQWKEQVYAMHEIGVTGILIQNVFDCNEYVHQHDMTADTYRGRAFYDSKLYAPRMPIAAKDPIEAILTAADECDMVVFPGVGMYAWFDFSPQSLEWHKRVSDELLERYGHHKSFYAMYISEEIMGALYYGYDPVPDEKYKDIQNFFKEYKAYLQEKRPTMPVALAPNNIRMHCYQDEWSGILENLDIMIPFAFARSENNVAEIAEMCEKTGTHFWVDMEIFDFPFDEGRLRPKTIDMLKKEIRQYDALEQIYGYQFTGLMNPPGKRYGMGLEETEVLYAAYQDYVRGIWAEQQAAVAEAKKK